jgi:phosphate transport system substrate-binding protein
MVLGAVFGCGRQSREDRVIIIGSDTMVNLAQAWAEEFIKIHPDYFIAVTGGGSGTGIACLINGTCGIAAASRKFKSHEMSVAEKNKVLPREIIVGLDGIAVVVHPENPIAELTIDQLSDIFTGAISHWSQLGWMDKTIVLLSREVNSGTHIYFKENVLRKGKKDSQAEFAPGALLLSSSQALADEVTGNPQGIGYYGMGYINAKQKALKIGKTKESGYYYPDIPNVVSGKYPISRPLFFYTNSEPHGRIKEFLDFALSPQGQDIVKKNDFVPIK